MILYRNLDVPYLPFPNTVETIASDEIAPVDLITTAFVIPLFADGSVLLAHNVKRGLEVPGGHLEPGETAEQAAIRELLEEAGATVKSLVPIGYQKLVSGGTVLEGWKYPHPISYQQFYAGLISDQFDYAENEECYRPVASHPNLAEKDIKPEHYQLYRQAVERLLIG
jgi:8-oxo-dGTP pyrophosphatase MutT (NUDIX family)